MKRILLLFIVFFIAGCAQAKNFNYGLKQINNLNSEYKTTMDTYPDNINEINLMINDFKELKNIQLETGQEQFSYIVDYRLLNLEAEKFYIEGNKYGSVGTTRDGFACKPRPLTIESVALRNKSALKGFEAVNLLQEFTNKYPKEAKLANLSAKNALFLNATFYRISNDAQRDSSIINRFCPINETLVLYKKEIKSKTNLSKDFIYNLTYDEAVNIWKKIRGIS